MIISTMALIFIWLLGSSSSLSTNPLKISMILTVFSALIFFSAGNSGSTWFPILFFLIFMGGILMMFMILSSILPNQKEDKKKLLKMALLGAMFLYLGLKPSNTSNLGLNSKSLLFDIPSLAILTLLMLGYFFFSISMVSEEKTALRSVLC